MVLVPIGRSQTTRPEEKLALVPSLDRKRLPHIEAARVRLENLWAAGTDYCVNVVEKARRTNAMLHLDMDLTGECKLKCFYCDRTPDRFNEIPNRIELTTAERKEIILQAKALGATTVEFPGAGEPMIDEGFWAIVEFIHENGMIPVIFTSGYHLDEQSIDRLYRNSATIFIKYNSSDTPTQDKMVGMKGYGEKATAALLMLVARGFSKTIPTRLAIDMVVTPKYHDLEEIGHVFRWCRDNNIHSYIQTLIPEGMADHKKMLLERQRADDLLEYMRKIDSEEYGIDYTPSRPMGGGYRCRQVNVGLFVNLFGEVYDCNGLGRVLGHIRKDSLAAIWNAKYAVQIRKPLQDGFCLLRERVWRGIDTSGMARKSEDYKRWESSTGNIDEVVRRAIETVS